MGGLGGCFMMSYVCVPGDTLMDRLWEGGSVNAMRLIATDVPQCRLGHFDGLAKFASKWFVWQKSNVRVAD